MDLNKRIDVFMKIIQKNRGGWVGGGVRADVNEEVKFL